MLSARVMRAGGLAVIACLLLAGGSAAPTPTAIADGSEPSVQLTRHVPELPTAARPAAPPATAASDAVQLTVVLNRTDEAGFQTYLRGVEDPRSQNGRKFLSSQDIVARFGPSQSAYDSVLGFLTQNGLSLVSRSANRLTITVRGTRAAVEKTFGLHLRDYQLNGRQFYAPDKDPSLPTSVAPLIKSVVGLSTLPQWHPKASSSNASTSSAPVPNPMALATAYDFGAVKTSNGAAATGAGQTVGLVEFDTITPSDLQAWLNFEQSQGWLTSAQAASMAANAGFVGVDGGSQPSGSFEGEREVLLDMSTVLGMAPGAKVVAYNAPYSWAQFSTSSFIDIVQAMLSSGVTQISSSWGTCESYFSSSELDGLESILQSSAASGVSFFAASGNSEQFCDNGTEQVSAPQFPASAPDAIAVGGTSLQVGSSGAYLGESWWDGQSPPPNLIGGGFGVSSHWTAPNWQGPSLNGSTIMRSMPDVAADADPATGIGLVCVPSQQGCPLGSPYIAAGTSMAAPEWAAGAALLGQVYGPLGNFNAALYTGLSGALHRSGGMSNSTGWGAQSGPTNNFSHLGLGSLDLGQIASAIPAVYHVGGPPPGPTPTPTPTPTVTLIQQLTQPVRLVDTRTSGGAISTGSSRCFTVAGQSGIPANAAGLVLNVTGVGYGVQGWLTLYPQGQPVPATSTLNFDPHQYAVANGIVARIGTNGQVCVNVGTVNSVPGNSQVILDATGYLSASALTDMPMLSSPQRLADTRTSGGAIATGSSRCFQVAGVDGIPSDAGAVILNVTAVGYHTQGWLTVYPAGQPVPATSTVNFDPSEYAIPNNAIMRLGTGGQVCVEVGTVNSAPGSSQVILDATGYLTSNGLTELPMLTSPQRIADTRANGGSIATAATRCFSVAGLAGVPSNATAVLLNVTAVGYGTRGWLTAYPAGQPVPATSTLNFDSSEYAIANGSIMRLGTGGQVCVEVGTVNSAAGVSQVILDVVGYSMN